MKVVHFFGEYFDDLPLNTFICGSIIIKKGSNFFLFNTENNHFDGWFFNKSINNRHSYNTEQTYFMLFNKNLIKLLLNIN